MNRNMTNRNNNHSHQYYISMPILFIVLSGTSPFHTNLYNLIDLIMQCKDVYEGQHQGIITRRPTSIVHDVSPVHMKMPPSNYF
jgi:hypothetical protein